MLADFIVSMSFLKFLLELHVEEPRVLTEVGALECSAKYLPRLHMLRKTPQKVFDGSPMLLAGEAGLQSSGKRSFTKMGFIIALDLEMPALKRMMKNQAFPGALEHSYPRINAGASTKKKPMFRLYGRD